MKSSLRLANGIDPSSAQRSRHRRRSEGVSRRAFAIEGPGPIRTELFDRANPPDAPRTRAIIDAVPVKRVGMPEDVAHAVSYLLDARSGFVTGQVLYVCGGMTVGVAGV